MAAERSLTHLSALVITVIFGGFTMFSTFSLETMVLIEREDVVTAVLCVAASVGLSIGEIAAGITLMRMVYQ